MLFKKTVKAAAAAALWMVALLGANSAMANLSFTDASAGTMAVFSAENLAGNGPTYPVQSSLLVVNGATFGTLTSVLNKSETIYIRLDVGGVLKLVATTPPTLGVGAAGSATPVDAANVSVDARMGYVIYTVTAVGARLSTDIAEVTFPTGSAVVSGIGNGTVRLRAYDNIRDAVDGTGSFLTGFNYSATALAVRRSLTVTAAKASRTATVVSGFTQFAVTNDSTPALESLGGVKIAVACYVDPTTGANVGATACDVTDPANPVLPTLADVNVDVAPNRSSVVISGDGGFAFAPNAASQLGLYPGMTTNNVNDPCGGTKTAVAFSKKLADGEGDPSSPVVGPVPANGATLSLCTMLNLPGAPNTTRIPEGDYMATVTVAAVTAGRPFPPSGAEDLMIGSIEHDGTSVNIPYISGYEGYTQRIVITNRNKPPVAYTLTFTTEGEGTADPMVVEGMAMGEMTTIIKVHDVVTLVNPTRASGTLDIVSSPSMVDVATNIVNKMDQSTDTVVLHLGNRDANN